jgi:hypothetical protein
MRSGGSSGNSDACPSVTKPQTSKVWLDMVNTCSRRIPIRDLIQIKRGINNYAPTAVPIFQEIWHRQQAGVNFFTSSRLIKSKNTRLIVKFLL